MAIDSIIINKLNGFVFAVIAIKLKDQMAQLIDDNYPFTAEHIYDLYASSLFGIILKISPDETTAEIILLKSFKIIFSQKINQANDKQLFLQLLQIIITLLAEHINISKEEIGRLIIEDINHHQSKTPYMSIPPGT